MIREKRSTHNNVHINDQSTYFFASDIHTGDKVLHCSDTAMDVDDLSLQSDTMDIHTIDEVVPCSHTAMEVELEVINLSLIASTKIFTDGCQLFQL